MEKSGRKIILAVTGASGSVYAMKLLDFLRKTVDPPAETAIIFSDNGREIWKYENGGTFGALPPEKEYDNHDFHAPFASGSSDYDTMIICPASMGMLARIAGGISDDLIARAADVMLKERRKLIVVPRETPYNLVHVRNMETILLAGGIVCPASPSFYGRPGNIDDLVMTVVERIVSLAGFDAPFHRWMKND
ncbi:MAG: UbiX family flavin prenyltransferase [Bacteroidales bacterium]|nr:UbiX family flavin prenyltransferase [Bacteroidales bacterium]